MEAVAVSLKDLYSLVEKDYDITLIAGRKGMNKPVRWLHMVENAEISSFLEGQEIAFTTGIGLQAQEDLIDLVKVNCDNKASAMVVNIGPFIRQIDPAVIRFCNENDFPLFKVPWKVHMAEIMRVFCFALTEAEKNNMKLAAALNHAILYPNQEEMYLQYMEQNGFLKNWNYCVALVDIVNEEQDQSVTQERLEAVRRKIESMIVCEHRRVAVLVMEHRLVIVFAKYQQDKIKNMMQEIMKICVRLLPEGETVYTGVGKVTKSARCISKSYYQGLKLEKLQRGRRESGGLYFYEEMGLYKLLLAVEDKEILEDYYRETIGPLEEYDKINHADCIQVLKSYLKHNGSVRDTAEEMFLHRNTINYKLNKIEEIVHMDLSDLETRQKMNIGFMIQEVLG